MKKLLSLLLAVLLCVGCFAVAATPASATVNPSNYKVGDIISYGTYPQTRVNATNSLRNAVANATWKSYGYVTTKKTIDMQYADVVVNGWRYRAVKFSEYRPFDERGACTEDNSYMDDNGYTPNTTYYFRYDPVKWRVLDPNTGLLMCEKIIDAQCFSESFLLDTSNFEVHAYQGSNRKVYANDYGKSSLHSFVSSVIAAVAFSANQIANVKQVTSNNEASISTSYTYVSTKDKVLIPSQADVLSTAYGFSSSRDADPQRVAYVTDYAKCQGILVSDNGASAWWLRTPAGETYISQVIKGNGQFYGKKYNWWYQWSICGVRPMIHLTRLEQNTSQSNWLSSSGKEDANYTEVYFSSQSFENGTVTGGGLYRSGASVVVRATPDAGKTFDGWYNISGTCLSTSTSYTFTLPTNVRSYYLNPKFRNYYKVTVNKSPGEGGTVTVSSTEPRVGTTVVLAAAPASGYNFLGWYKGSTKVSSELGYVFTPTGDVTLTAKFEKATSGQYTVSVRAEGNGTVSGGGSYAAGSTATVTARSGSGARFEGWYEGSTRVSTSATYQFTVNGSRTLTAKFSGNGTVVRPDQNNVTVVASPAEGGTVSGGGNVPVGDSVNVIATPNSGWHFVGWYIGDTKVSDSEGYAFPKESGETTLTAKFEQDGASSATVCTWCGGDHSEGFFQMIIGWFHGILALLLGARY
ncbi:MAG: InlB B-repeat-containing protein [Clostridia bacterium]|nr:InlB B-repeat-containing protein [Clostridia bacterium]